MSRKDSAADFTKGLNILLSTVGYQKSEYRLYDTSDGYTSMIDTQRVKGIPILWWRKIPQLVGMKSIIDNGLVKDVSALRILKLGHKTDCLKEIIYQEFDICMWFTGSYIDYVYAISAGENAFNIIAKMKNNIVCTFELATILDEYEEIVNHHEVITAYGIVSDKVVDTQINQSAVYLYNSELNCKTYNDIDNTLYGFERDDILKARFALDVLKDSSDIENLPEHGRKLERIVDSVFESANNNCKVYL